MSTLLDAVLWRAVFGRVTIPSNRELTIFRMTLGYVGRHLLPTIEAEARAAVLRELREEVADLSEWLSTCRCFVINPKFGEGQPGGHFTDCAWAQESDVRDEILAAIDRRLAP